MIHAAVYCECCGHVLSVDGETNRALCDKCDHFENDFENEVEDSFSLAYLVDENSEYDEFDEFDDDVELTEEDDDLW